MSTVATPTVVKASKPGKVTIAHHAGQIISPKSTASIIKQAGLTVDQFRALL
jgi:predicted RNA binding protein YcfA (HicA-like mRNA interferase family)